DWAVSSANPLRAIHVAVNRALHGAAGAEAEPFLPEQSLALGDALAAYTLGSAYVNHLDAETGTVEAGHAGRLGGPRRAPFRGAGREERRGGGAGARGAGRRGVGGGGTRAEHDQVGQLA